MTLKSTVLTSVAAIAAAVTIAAAPASAESYGEHAATNGRHRVLPRVEAVGASLNPGEARRIAVHAWRDKVAARYGFEYSRWFAARNKDVDCRKVADDDPVWDKHGRRSLSQKPRHYEPVTRCTVSASPARGWSGFGWSF